ncbi:4-hydroxy-3-methylbut-2-enyl diphosphate reductase [Desulfosarcina sp.]|uniref:4-hydroxy-3-methylbut-2-enyl diphosphate reductase n=1 Tax=Desulfosarcina sp. TaxID=2027861 RepID=UPI00397054EA
MKIEIAKTAGFCMGVRRAVELALDAPGKHAAPIYTYGPLIHNPQVLSLFAEKGITVLKTIPEQGSGTVLVRAHGVPPEDKQRLKAAGFRVVDATCPRVIRVQTIIRVHARKGYTTIIVGDRDHPEVIGLVGHAGDSGIVVSTMAELEALPAFDQAIIVAQTTQNLRFYQQVKAWAQSTFPQYKAYDTICDSTEKRQAEIKQLADRVEAVIVVGGKDSGNTRRLAEIAAETGKPAFHVETEADLKSCCLDNYNRVGITAGASTPNWIIKRVYRELEKLPARRHAGLVRILYRAMQTLLLTNVYVAMGAGCLCLAGTRLLEIKPSAAPVAVAMLYVLSMHLLNHLTGTAEDEYNDPERARFYEQNRLGLSVMAIAAGGLGILSASAMGAVAFVILLVMSLLGLSYNLYLLPGRFGFKFRRIKDIPGSKTCLIAVAWGVVAVLLPGITGQGTVSAASGVVFVWATALVFARTAFFDLLDVQGDRIMGKETLPILLGSRKTVVLLKSILVGCMLLVCVGSAVGLISGLGFLIALCPAAMLALVHAYEKGLMLPSMRLEFMVESLFLLSGFLTLLWMMADTF